MFADLKLIVDLIRDGVSDFRNRKAVEDRDRIVLDLLKTYFLLKDCVEGGGGVDQRGRTRPDYHR